MMTVLKRDQQPKMSEKVASMKEDFLKKPRTDRRASSVNLFSQDQLMPWHLGEEVI